MKLKRTISILLLVLAHSNSYAGENIISPAQARQIAESRYGGKVLSIKLEDGRAYRIKMIKGGRVKIVTIDAKQ